ncbi:hypothetical protein LMG32289_05534 [Cupriavidus pampae]|jgi:hypothetical protein|uniref:IclR family transcriptional regulator n=1 Tax=Cupriavidus pampae TaxID=659251 RepID=A0ABN7ZDW0_9BURK|nr:hypothetical protein LMG32289_05534 [Cupriavidus pampae]
MDVTQAGGGGAKKRPGVCRALRGRAEVSAFQALREALAAAADDVGLHLSGL